MGLLQEPHMLHTFVCVCVYLVVYMSVVVSVTAGMWGLSMYVHTRGSWLPHFETGFCDKHGAH